MRRLLWEEFAEAAETVYRVEGEGSPGVEMTFENAVELPSSGREGGSFRLEFRGPFEPILPQGIYEFHGGEEPAEIFIVPVGRQDSGTLYEAVFY